MIILIYRAPSFLPKSYEVTAYWDSFWLEIVILALNEPLSKCAPDFQFYLFKLL